MVHLAIRGTKREDTERPCSLRAHLSPCAPPSLARTGEQTPAAGAGLLWVPASHPLTPWGLSPRRLLLVGWAQTQSIPARRLEPQPRPL